MEKIIEEWILMSDVTNKEFIKRIIETHDNLVRELEETKLKINQLEKDNGDLKNKTVILNEEKKTKSSSALWESTQAILKEKDTIIEDLKKEIEFYKRNSGNFSKSNSVINKYAWADNCKNVSKSFENTNILNNNDKKNDLELKPTQITQDLNLKSNLNLKSESEIKPELKQELEPEINQVQELKPELKQELEPEINQELELSQEPKTKSKPKNKKDKEKSKKKKIIEVEEDDLDDLEKELSGLA